jgi:hypothetical protein
MPGFLLADEASWITGASVPLARRRRPDSLQDDEMG